MEQRNDVPDVLQEEWTYTKNFWVDSDGELAKYQQRKQDTREETELPVAVSYLASRAPEPILWLLPSNCGIGVGKWGCMAGSKEANFL